MLGKKHFDNFCCCPMIMLYGLKRNQATCWYTTLTMWSIDQFCGCCVKSSKNDDVPSMLHPRPNLYIIIDSFLFVVMGKNINCLNMFSEISSTFESFQRVFFQNKKRCIGLNEGSILTQPMANLETFWGPITCYIFNICCSRKNKM